MSCFGLFLRYRQLLWHLILLDVKVRHAGSRMGLLWVVLAPACVLAAYLLLFGAILKVRPVAELSALDYGFFVACGLIPWLGFSEGITSGTGSVLAQRSLMKSRLFPMELIPATVVCTGLIGQVISLTVLLLVLATQGTLGAAVLVLPVLLLLQAMLTLGMVWFLSCVNILYRDLSQMLGLLIVLLMFVSPIAYTEEMVPTALRPIVQLNPLSYLIEWYRQAMLFNQLPHPSTLALFGMLAVLLLQGGYVYFMRLRRLLPDLV